MKYYVLIMMIGAMPLKGITTLASTSEPKSIKEQQYYISHSPYYTAGYLTSHTEYSHFSHGPSPYWRSKDISKPVNIVLRKKYI